MPKAIIAGVILSVAFFGAYWFGEYVKGDRVSLNTGEMTVSNCPEIKIFVQKPFAINQPDAEVIDCPSECEDGECPEECG